MQPQLLRDGDSRDAATVAALATQVFLDTYAADGVRPDLAREAFTNYSEQAFAERLAQPHRKFLLAERQGALVGFAEVLVSAAPAPAGHVTGAELVRLYVQPAAQRHGVGRTLIGAAEQLAAGHGHASLWLTAWQENERARAFYQRMGYADLGTTPYVFEDQTYINRVLAKRVRADVPATPGSRAAAPRDVLTHVPADLPVPVDDGACDHLPGLRLPPVALASTGGRRVDLSALPGWVVVFCYPMTGKPGVPVPHGWADIPGAAGCTPQSCAYRDHHAELQVLGAQVFGVSAQSTEDQAEAAQRLHLPYELLSDAGFALADALRLPQFEAGGRRLIRRVTLVCHDGVVLKHFYPVFPPDRDADQVIDWLRAHAARGA